MFERLERICLVPRVSGVGGMVSFQHRFKTGLHARGIEVCADLADTPYQAVLVIGGTRQLAGLWQARQRGIPIVQRLDGMNWLHRLHRGEGKEMLPAGLRHFLRAEYGNWLLRTIRTRLATRLVYQSMFVRHWWQRVYGEVEVPSQVIYNAVDTAQYTPRGGDRPPDDFVRLLLVEGNLGGGYEQGLGVAVELAARLSRLRLGGAPRQVELVIVGGVSPELRQAWETRLREREGYASVRLVWQGVVRPEHIPPLERSAHLLYSADINSACPNAVIEALACGLPVLAFDTGALPELLQGEAGRTVPYGGDPWKLDPPDMDALVAGAVEILTRQSDFRAAARARALAMFNLDDMLDAYLEALAGDGAV